MPAQRNQRPPRDRRTSDPAALERYDAKRDFSRTTEPPPERPATGEGPLTFVIQKHAARRLHYDFRLEAGGVLVSWSVPKGPSLDPKEKRLAVMVEDHPLDYGSFEGVIPKGQYCAGQVIVWDNGTYSPDEGGLSFHDRAAAEERMRQGIAGGKLSITMRGRKMKGSWTLVKTTRAERDWLLIKHQDVAVDTEREITDKDRSVLCGLTIEDLKAGRLPDRAAASVILSPADASGVTRAAWPSAPKPMMATLSRQPFSHPAWLFEPKLDGVRALACVRDGAARLIGRSGREATDQYPALAKELAAQPAHEVIFDGEIVAFDDDGRPSFETIQQRLNLTRPADIQRADVEVPVVYYAFDLLYLDGYDLRAAPLEQRRALLARALLPTGRVRPLEHFESDGDSAFEAAREHGLEGIVAKKRDSRYQSGRRSRDWLKIKSTLSEELVVGGFSAGEGGRGDTFGALLVGYYEDGDKLTYAGHVGSGFTDRALVELRERLEALRTDECPFAEEPPQKTKTAWVRPELVAEVSFAQWTREGSMRAPVFVRLRDDKPPREARRVDAVAPPDASPENGPVAASGVGAVLDQLADERERFVLQVEGRKVSVTNLSKPLWPALGKQRALTKRDLLLYLTTVSPYLLPHLRDRPLTLTRYPNGIAGGHFYQKHVASPIPEFVETVRLFSSHNEGDGEYILCNNLATLLWLGQLADLELHPWYSRVGPEPDGHHLAATFTGSKRNIERSLLNYPDFIVFDLDPYIYSGRETKGAEPELNRKAFKKTCEAALWLKDVLDSLSLSSFVKTTGRTGLHIYVPVLRQLDYSAARAASETVCSYLLQQHPREVTMEWTVEKRAGKVFLDHNQNARGKTLASIYSPRPLPEAAVSMPVRWDELSDVYPTDFTLLTAPARLAQLGDLWSGILDAKHDIEGLLGAR